MAYMFEVFLFAYLCGSIPFGYLIARSKGINIQKRGSGNIGFANVRRTMGWSAGLLTLSGDIVKGIVPTIIALKYFGYEIAFWTGIFAILGHVFTIWLGFKGGKGIATGLGVVMVLSPIAAIYGALIYIMSSIILKKSSTSSIAGCLVLSLTGTALTPSYWWHYSILLAIAGWTLRKNLTNKVPNYNA